MKGFFVGLMKVVSWLFGAITLVLVTIATWLGIYWCWDRWNTPRRWHEILRVVLFYILLGMGTVAFLGANEWWSQRVIMLLPLFGLKAIVGFIVLVYAFVNVYWGARRAYATRPIAPRTRWENVQTYLRFLGSVVAWVAIFLIVGKWWLVLVGLW